jgi:hypothetical protein
MADVVSAAFDPEKDRVVVPLAEKDPCRLAGCKSNGMNPLKSKVPLVGKSSGVLKSVRPVEFTQDPKAVPHPERAPFLPHEEEDVSGHRDMTVRDNDPPRPDQELCPFGCAVRRTIDGSFQGHALDPDEMGNVRRRERGMEIGLNRKDPEKKKKGEADEGAPNGFFQSDEKEPSRQEPRKEQEECLSGSGKFETAETKTEGVGEEYGNERKAERLTHLNPKKSRNNGILR